ncbi:MAG: GNAT family N-acetyltransferase [Clostridium cadaveris]|uniref:GNAT family N-acetyltransferase n=1 Tax=Clostridium cadaveris TaxID=1529 RepID=UPI002A8442DB|nr:GNAT family N-acetyltransferase [Clostridium cadaveris]
MDRIYFEKFLSNDDLTEAEIEYMLLPDYWRQGYGSEITTKLLKIARESDSIQTLVANVKPDNIGSKTILLKTGFAHCKFFENLDNGSPVEMFNKNIVH